MSPARQLSEKLLRQLHAVMRQGAGETIEADLIRDQMDVPWYQMTPEEQDEIRKLSAALYDEK